MQKMKRRLVFLQCLPDIILEATHHPSTANDDLLLKLFSKVLRLGLMRTPHLHTKIISTIEQISHEIERN